MSNIPVPVLATLLRTALDRPLVSKDAIEDALPLAMPAVTDTLMDRRCPPDALIRRLVSDLHSLASAPVSPNLAPSVFWRVPKPWPSSVIDVLPVVAAFTRRTLVIKLIS